MIPRIKDRNTMRTIGLWCLLLGNGLHLLIHPAAPVAQNLVDGVFGVLFGVSIGCILLSLRRTDRQCSG